MKIVVFTSNNARIHEDTPRRVAEIAAMNSNSLIEPNIQEMIRAGVKPHYWKIKNGCLAAMTEEEKDARDRDHIANGVDNYVEGVSKKRGVQTVHTEKELPAWAIIALGAGIAACMAAAGAAYMYFHHYGRI